MIKLAKDATACDALSAKIDPDVFKKAWRINSTISKATICLLAQFSPRSFISNAPIDLGQTLAAYNSREFHHIYPKAYLTAQGLTFSQANVVANICMIIADDNKAISDKGPSVYFPELPAKHRTEVFDSAIIAKDFRDGSKPYADFIAKRSQLLAAVAEEMIKFGSAKTVSF